MTLRDRSAVEEQYRSADRLETRISIHEKYSVNRQGFGNWIVSHYRFRDGMRVLELGCGSGAMWAGRGDLAAKCSELILSDLSEGMLREARRRLTDIPGITYRVIDIQRIPYEDRSFDAVIAHMMLYHVPDLPRGLAEVRRVLKEDGTFYCATYGERGIMAYIAGLFASCGVTDRPNHSFTLQNGGEQLARFFPRVRHCDYPDALEVTDLDDMADYILSLSGMTALRALPRETLLAVLREHAADGVLRVPKEYGMFIAGSAP